MPYFRVDDKLHSHVKAMRAGAPALGLWVMAASWCMDQLTDGWVPEYAALRLDPQAEQHAEALVRAGLWHVEDRDGERGWLFHEWDEWQHSAAYLEERRRRNADRMRTQRANGDAGKGKRAQSVRAHSVDSADTVSSTPTTTATTTKTAGADAPESFASWWDAYPRKVGKQAAVKAYTKALKATDASTLLAGLHAAAAGWKACGTEARFIPHPATWLNEGRWEDQPALEVTADGATATLAVRRRELPAPPPELAGDPRAEQEWLRQQAAALQAGGAR